MRPFIPFELPVRNLDFERLVGFIEGASKKLSMYNGILQVIPNPHILLVPLSMNEAVLSSKIEGTQVSFAEILQYEADERINETKKNDIEEVLNYKLAMLEAEKMFQIRPFIHLNMIRNLHAVLLNGVRGNSKSRGEFRKIQVYIGSPGCSIENATFVPPEAQNILPSLDNWEKYINSDMQTPLLQCSIMHAQFEMIHPFLDGNGRIGRMLIPLFLYQKGYICEPVFYLSEFFEKNRQEYYEKLNNISSKNDWNSWVEFFLKAIIEQSDKNIKKSRKIIDLYNNMKEEFVRITHSEFAINILDNLFKKPIIASNKLCKLSKINTPRTANNLFRKLVNSGVLKLQREGRGSRSTIYKFDELIKIAEE